MMDGVLYKGCHNVYEMLYFILDVVLYVGLCTVCRMVFCILNAVLYMLYSIRFCLDITVHMMLLVILCNRMVRLYYATTRSCHIVIL